MASPVAERSPDILQKVVRYGPAGQEGHSMGKFIAGLLLGAIATVGVVIYLMANKAKPPEDNEIMFARKLFIDTKQTGMDFDFVAISGTLTGKGLPHPNNTYAVSCNKEYKACFVSFVEQIGHNQIGRMENPLAYPIVRWNDYEIVAQDEPSPIGCFRVTLTIDRRSQALLWLEEPANQTKPNCKDADTNIRKYSIEDSPGWKRLSAR
jgi:hypothetical protein